MQNFNQNLWMNCAAPPFDNLKVRRAIALAINKELIVKALLQGFGRVQDSYIGNLPAITWAHDPAIKSEFNPAKANQLLDEAGLPRKGGTRFAVTLLATEGFRVKLSEALKAMLAPIGIEASIKSYTWATYIARIRQDRDTAGCIWSSLPVPAGRSGIRDGLPERPQRQAGRGELVAVEPRRARPT